MRLEQASCETKLPTTKVSLQEGKSARKALQNIICYHDHAHRNGLARVGIDGTSDQPVKSALNVMTLVGLYVGVK